MIKQLREVGRRGRGRLIVFIKPFFPPIIWKVVRLVFIQKFSKDDDNQVVIYQYVTQGKFLTQMHDGIFSKIHEKFALLDTHINRNTNLTRLRVYTLCTWAQVCLTNTKNGDFLAAGISFGTSSLVVSEFSKLENQNRKQYFIDPMDGRGGISNYNTDRSLVESRWNHAVPLIWIQEPLSIKALDKVGDIAFVHLNTGAWEVEVECLPSIYQKLVPGGILIMDYYGWKPREMQLVVNQILDKMGAKYFITPSLQLIVLRQ
jgi:hypothetical protein